MKALTLPAGRGWYWLSGGFRLFRKGRLMLSLAILAYWLCMALINSFPIVGQIAAFLLVPAFSVGLMNVCRLIEQGGPLQAQALVAGLRQNQHALLVLGVVYIVASVCILGIVSLIDGGVLFRGIFLGEQVDERMLSSGEFVLAVQIALLLYSPIMMTYLFAPVLVVWHGFPAGKSLFFSLVACARNWRAFLAYGMAILLYGALLPGVLVGLLVSVIPGGSELFSVLLPMLIMLIFLPTLYASFYVSYRDIFVSIDENA